MAYELTERLRAYAPYKQTLEELRNELESDLVTGLNRYTRGSMIVLSDNFHSLRLKSEQILSITDELMGVLFDKLTPFSANFIKLNDYSLRVHSLSALRVLYVKYASYFSPQELSFMVGMIRTLYPPERYADWLVEADPKR